MFQPPRKKYIIGLDRYILNDKQNPNNYLYVQIHNGLNSNKSKNQNSLKSLKKSSSQFSVNKNKSNKNNNHGINKNISPNINKKSSSVKPAPNIKSYNKRNNYYKFLMNSSNYEKNNKKSNSLYKDNKANGKYNIKLDKNGSSFINNQRSKTPMSNKENNGRIILNYKNKAQYNNGGYHDNTNANKSNVNLLENRSLRSYNNSIFQPVNIFSQFKKNRGNNNDELVKNTQLLKKFLQDSKQRNDIDKNNSFKMSHRINNKINNNSNILIENNNNNFSQNIISKTNDTTPINSNYLINSKLNNNNNHNNRIIINNMNNNKNKNNYIRNNSNNNNFVNNNSINVNSSLNNNSSINNNGSIIFDKNDYVKEINFQVNGISSNKNGDNKKKKVFKGKKIKCMHDLSKTGLSGDDKKVNQDNYFIFKNFVQGFENIYMGVCDGHGYYGHEVSGYIKENLPMDLNHMIKTKKLNILKDDISSIIKTAFILENKSLLRNKQIDSDLSGSTCVSVIYTPQKLIIANIGDSRCVLGKCIEPEKDEEIFSNIHEESNPNQKKLDSNKKWVALNLSRDHKPTIPEEAKRILKTGGRIRQMKDDDGEFIGPLRVYMKEKDMPGLAMTRSFGDYYGSTAGVISEPEVTEYYLKEEDKFMVLASDGLFEFMESQEVVEIIKDYYEKNDIVGCCEYLYKESTIKWLREEEDTIDDITIILVFFEDYFDEVNE